MKNSNLTTKLKTESLTYPILAWSEQGSKSAMLLISAPDKIQIIDSFHDHNFPSLLRKLGTMLKTGDLMKTALEGDETSFSFNIPEFEDLNLNWNNLLNDIEHVIAQQEVGQGFAKEIRAELQANIYRDIAASAITAIYGSMLYILLTKASILGITEIMFLGNLQDPERLSAIAAEHLPEHMNLMMWNL